MAWGEEGEEGRGSGRGVGGAVCVCVWGVIWGAFDLLESET